MWTFRVQFTFFSQLQALSKTLRAQYFHVRPVFCVTSWVLRLTIVQRVIGTFLIKRSERVVKSGTQK